MTKSSPENQNNNWADVKNKEKTNLAYQWIAMGKITKGRLIWHLN